ASPSRPTANAPCRATRNVPSSFGACRDEGGRPRSMILEGIVTTTSAAGEVNVAPMGPRFPEASGEPAHFVLRPFRTARTYRNLREQGEGVLPVTDAVLLLARAALGPVEPPPPLFPAARVRGWVLRDACRYHEFRVVACDDRAERAELTA